MSRIVCDAESNSIHRQSRRKLQVATMRTLVVVLFALLAMGVVPAVAQEHETATELEAHDEHSAGHEFHRNHFGGVLGVSLHHDSDETAPTLGLEYARQFTPKWAAAGYIELVSSDLERDIIVAAGVIFYPVHWLGLVVAPGVEQATREVDHSGEVKQEEELEFLLRIGVAAGIRLTPEASIGPTVFVDRAGDKYTTVLGVGMVVGF